MRVQNACDDVVVNTCPALNVGLLFDDDEDE
jgi:hypothetical protein